MSVDLDLRRRIYSTLATEGRAPTRAEIGDDTALRELHDAHMVVLGDDGEIAMALPFANRPTTHRVVSDSESWWANCAWDALAVPAALGRDATIDARWIDTGEEVDLAISNGMLVGDTDGFVHFQVPARHWWDDIVET